MGDVAAHMITTDTSPVSSLAICRQDRGGCGWRSPVFRTRAKALASANAHREQEHAEQASDAERVASTRRAS